MRPTLTLPLVGAAALATAIAGVVAVPHLSPVAGSLSSVTAQGAVAPQPLVLPDETAHVAQRKAHSRAVAAGALAAREKAAAEKAAAEAAAKAAAEREKARASRARRAVASGDPRSIARAMLAARGQAGQFGCLDRLWTKESEWRVRATNPSSGAYGIPQSLPASKMASAGSDWRTNPRTQIAWGLGYISDRYGSPCAAWRHSQARNWY